MIDASAAVFFVDPMATDSMALWMATPKNVESPLSTLRLDLLTASTSEPWLEADETDSSLSESVSKPSLASRNPPPAGSRAFWPCLCSRSCSWTACSWPGCSWSWPPPSCSMAKMRKKPNPASAKPKGKGSSSLPPMARLKAMPQLSISPTLSASMCTKETPISTPPAAVLPSSNSLWDILAMQFTAVAPTTTITKVATAAKISSPVFILPSELCVRRCHMSASDPSRRAS
mmetsp:Transcript_70020/g.186052  ORF Transcript_70020/g.186052 Transcript_70020/m.186052 type:complete len:231 (-) Transcript_70020:12-704(-)